MMQANISQPYTAVVHFKSQPTSLLDDLEVTKPFSMARQGDILLKKLETKPPTLNPISPIGNKYCLVGSSNVKHVINIDAVKSFETTDKELESVLVLKYPTKVTHDEHKEIPLSEGVWMVIRQREYKPDAMKFVAVTVPVAD